MVNKFEEFKEIIQNEIGKQFSNLEEKMVTLLQKKRQEEK